MTPEQAIAEATKGALKPVYLILGEERFLVDAVVVALREATAKGGVAGFNEDRFTAGESSIDAILGAAKQVPMMAKRRFLLVRGLERWEKKSDDADEAAEAPRPAGKKGARHPEMPPLDALAEYAKAPVSSTVMVLVAPKLHGQRRLVTGGKKAGFLVACEPLARRALPGWIEGVAREKGHPIAADVADSLAEMAGPELGYVADALERLSLFVGPGAPITEDALAAVVTRVRQSSVWEMIDALGKRRLDLALGTLADVFDPRDGGLRLLGAVAWSVRQMVKLESAMRAGANPGEAAQRAGVNPYKAQEIAAVVRSLSAGTLPTWLRLLSETDLALKGSRRPGLSILEGLVIQMCAR